MTKGIIQEVFTEQIKAHKQLAIDNTDALFARVNQEVILMLERLQQELIEKIKQEMSVIRDSCYMDEIFNRVCMSLLGIEDAENKQLIGDNQE